LNATGWVAEKAEGLALVDDYTGADQRHRLRCLAGRAGRQRKEIEGSDVTKCMVDADGKIVNDGKCAKGAASLRFTTNDVNDRAQRLWTFRFSKKLSEYGAL
jgi:hypothetical protein